MYPSPQDLAAIDFFCGAHDENDDQMRFWLKEAYFLWGTGVSRSFYPCQTPQHGA